MTTSGRRARRLGRWRPSGGCTPYRCPPGGTGTTTTHHRSSPPRIPALDGLRGLAVGGVLAYHCGFGWARGGFLGVSLFFTLSGFLITSLLLSEAHGPSGRPSGDHGRPALGAFWARRARRLLPAATMALAGIVVFGATVATAGQLDGLRADVLAALAYVANWRFVLDGAAYGDLWSAPSPVQHFWSLAIEEQLYVVLPLAIWAVGARVRATAAVLTVALALSITAAVLVAGDQLRAYYGTDVRAAELLAGALLAVAVTARPELGRRARAVPVAAWLALAGLLAAWATTTQTDGRLYAGGLHLHALAVVLVIVAARRDGLLASALSAPPLRWLGRISYAAYLYHWPLFLWLTSDRTGLDGVPLAALRLSVSLGLAWVSTIVVEDPIRAGRWLRTATARTTLATSAAALVVGVVVVTDVAPSAPPSVFDTAAPQQLIAPPTVLASSSPPSLPPVETAAPIHLEPGERLRVYVAGDSNAYILGDHLQRWSEGKPIDVWSSGWFGCPLVPGGEFHWADRTVATDAGCDAWAERRAYEISEIKPHIAVVISGSFDVLDRRLPGSDRWHHVGEPAYDALLKEQVAKLADLLRYGGARVLWAAYPHSRTGIIEGVVPDEPFPEWDPARMDRYNTIVRQVVAARPGAQMMELSRQMSLWPGGELDQDYRLDGIHPNPDVADDVAAWIGDQVLRLVERP